MPNPEDPQDQGPSMWDELPEEFTPEWVRYCPGHRLIEIEKNFDDLTPLQQSSYRRSIDEVVGPSLRAARKAIQGIQLPDMSKISVSPEMRATMDRITGKLQNQIATAYAIGATGATGPAVGPTGQTGPSGHSTKPPTQTVGPAGIPPSVQFGTPAIGATAASLAVDLEATAESASPVAEGIAALVRGQEREEDDYLLTGLVAFAVIVAGVAPIVAAPTWTERAWTVGVSVGFWFLALAAYQLKRRKRTR